MTRSMIPRVDRLRLQAACGHLGDPRRGLQTGISDGQASKTQLTIFYFSPSLNLARDFDRTCQRSFLHRDLLEH